MKDPTRGQVETFVYAYDMTQTVVRTIGMDSGDRKVLLNVMGNPVRGEDSNGSLVLTDYDDLHRPVTKTLRVSSVDKVVERFVYGESAGDTEYGVTDVAARNLYGRLYLHYDQAGRVKASQYDMAGQIRKTERQLRTIYKTEADWPGTEASRVALLETETFATETQYDALGRVSLRVAPDNPGGTGSTIRATYHPTGWLDELYVLLKGESTERTFVSEITYNAKGQRERIDYGNGVYTTYSYEPTTFRMTGLVTTRESDSKVLQDITYVYDPVGNIVKLTDASHDCVFANNQQVNAACGYTYDAMYRLTAAAGREHIALAQDADTDATAFLRSAWAHLNNSQQLVNYTENYVYDTAGNLTQMQHAGASTYTRYIDIDTATNRGLQRPDQGSPDFTNSFDANGNQILMGHLNSLTWDFQDRLQRVVLIPRNDDQDDAEWYVYDGSGQRVRKVRETVGYGGTTVTIEEKIYLGDAEIKRIYRKVYDEYGDPISTTKILDRTSLHVMDDKSRVALVHHWTLDTDELEVDSTLLNTHRLRYQFGNHLGSAALELDASGDIISYEEYLPYGGTSFVAGTSQTEVSLKEYRYSGKERDNSTGFYYYGARYYAPWVGRWVSTDPAGPVDGPNLYWFVKGNPISNRDSGGTRTRRILSVQIGGVEGTIENGHFGTDGYSPCESAFVCRSGYSIEPWVRVQTRGVRRNVACSLTQKRRTWQGS